MGETSDRLRGKVEQAVGGIKKNVGDAIDNPNLEAEGRAEEARGHARETGARVSGTVKGAANEVGGAIRSTVGDTTDDPAMQAEGEAQKIKGRVQREASR